jgi:hypothetical protein
MINRISTVFKKFRGIEAEVKRYHRKIKVDFGGGCSTKKSILMASLIRDFNIHYSVDIGVYRGRSLFPMAAAHKLFSGGIAFGVDPYSSDAAVQHDRPDLKVELDSFARETNFEGIYQEVIKLIRSNNLERNCKIVRKTASEAITEFKSMAIQFGLVHIDGNHDTNFVMEDIKNYVPLLSDVGFVVLDDISWDSVAPAMSYLSRDLTFINKLVDHENDFALFAKGLTKQDIEKILIVRR